MKSSSFQDSSQCSFNQGGLLMIQCQKMLITVSQSLGWCEVLVAETFTHWNQNFLHQQFTYQDQRLAMCAEVGSQPPLSSSLFPLFRDISIITCTSKWNTMNAFVEKLSKSAHSPHLCNLSRLVPLYFLSFQMYPGLNGKRKAILAGTNFTNLPTKFQWGFLEVMTCHKMLPM